MNNKYLYSPWRMDYILGEKPDDCVMCRAKHSQNDQDNLILHRGEHGYIMLNRYPYNNGHLMIVPYAHVCSLADLSAEAWQEIADLIRLCENLLYSAYSCQGINIGINLGAAAGAGIAEHVHIHLVPRWSGDSNFMSVVSGERVIPESFELAYQRLSTALDKLLPKRI